MHFFCKKMLKNLRMSKKSRTFALDFATMRFGAIAQLVEQRTENPCVTGSIPVGTTREETANAVSSLFIFYSVFRYLSASIAALQPLPAATIAWR